MAIAENQLDTFLFAFGTLIIYHESVLATDLENYGIFSIPALKSPLTQIKAVGGFGTVW